MITKKLREEARSIMGGLFALNAPKKIGYLFNEHIDNGSIAVGMFCDRSFEIDHNQWDYFMDMEGKIWKLTLKKSKALRDFYNKIW